MFSFCYYLKEFFSHTTHTCHDLTTNLPQDQEIYKLQVLVLNQEDGSVNRTEEFTTPKLFLAAGSMATTSLLVLIPLSLCAYVPLLHCLPPCVSFFFLVFFFFTFNTFLSRPPISISPRISVSLRLFTGTQVRAKALGVLPRLNEWVGHLWGDNGDNFGLRQTGGIPTNPSQGTTSLSVPLLSFGAVKV
jgi:hypothetical protein